jgi:allatostatin receptor
VSLNPQMKNTTNLLILNLAVADLLFILVCVPFTAIDYVLMYWPFGLFWCRTVQYTIYVTAYISIYTLVLMAGDRFLAVVFPISSMTIRTIPNARVAIIVTWLIILISNIPIWLTHNLLQVDKGQDKFRNRNHQHFHVRNVHLHV